MSRSAVSYEVLYDYMVEMFEKGLGYPAKAAEITAKVMVEADARGHASHGVARLQMYHGHIEKGFCDPNGSPRVVHQTPVSAVIDGQSAPGFLVAEFAMKQAIAKARDSGTCSVAVNESCHFGMSGYWAEMAADAGMIGWAMTGTLRSGIPLFGKERLIGTNPIAVAIPTGRKPHFLLDMATTTVAFGKIEVAARRGKEMPLGWAVDENGLDTSDAVSADESHRLGKSAYGGQLYLGGTTEALGGHKGYGLAMLVELMTAGFSMGCPSYETYRKTPGVCHYFQATRMDLFGDETEIKSHVAEILDRIKNSALAEGQSRIYIHGEKEYENRQRALTEGIWLDDATWEALDGYADRFGVPRLMS